MIDINDLGTTYTVMDKSTGETINMQLVFLESFLDLVGTYDPNHFPFFDEYLDDTDTIIDGHVHEIHNITWYAKQSNDIDFMEAIKAGAADGNRLVIIETLPED